MFAECDMTLNDYAYVIRMCSQGVGVWVTDGVLDDMHDVT